VFLVVENIAHQLISHIMVDVSFLPEFKISIYLPLSSIMVIV
jgi:hypothetical protein